MPHVDLMVAGELRFPGGSSRRLSRIVEVALEAGLRVAILPIRSRLVGAGVPWHPAITALAAQDTVHVIGRTDDVHATVALLDHPSVFEDLAALPARSVAVERVLMIANQGLRSAAGAVLFDPGRTHVRVAELLVSAPRWFPTVHATAPELVAGGVPAGAVEAEPWDDLDSTAGEPATDGGGARSAEAVLLRRLGLPAGPRSRGTRPAAGVVPEVRHRTGRPRVMFITSNGAGMGHLTRELGVARALADDVDPIFFSMSQAVPVVATFGFAYEYVPFNSALRVGSKAWNAYFAQRLSWALSTYEPAVVVFDGVWPYLGLLKALRRSDARKVWVRRGMWKQHVPARQLDSAVDFDCVIEPGDYASAYDRGATTRVHGARRVGPITVLDTVELQDRQAARRELGLPPGGQIALVTLGAGNINDIGDVQRAFIDAVAGLDEGWHSVVTRAPIASSGPTGAATVSVFPLARYAHAFDFAVSATGYNSFHEWIGAALPTIWLPNAETVTDDQTARGAFAADHGLGPTLHSPTAQEINATVLQLADPRERSRIADAMRAVAQENGAHAAARIIRELMEGPR